MNNNTTEKIKTLTKSAANFLKMHSEETSEMIKVNYWTGMENQIKSLNIDDNIVLKIIFEEILLKSPELLKLKNLLFCMINFLKEKKESLFMKYFFDLLYIFLQNYEENKYYFQYFLTELGFNLFFYRRAGELFPDDSLFSANKFFISLIEFDTDLANILFKSNFEKCEFIDIILSDKSNLMIFTYYINKLIVKKKLECLSTYLEKIAAYVENISKTKDYSTTFKERNVTGFIIQVMKQFNEISHKIEKNFTYEQNYIILLIKVSQLSLNISRHLMINDDYVKTYMDTMDRYLIQTCENIILSHQMIIVNMEVLIDIFNDNAAFSGLENFRKIFPFVMYHFLDEICDIKGLELYLKFLSILAGNFANGVMHRLMLKTLQMSEKLKYNKSFEVKCETNKIALSKDIQILANCQTKKSIPLVILPFYSMSNLDLLSYILSSTFTHGEDLSSSTTILFFKESKLRDIVATLYSIGLDNLDSEFMNCVIKFLFRILFTIYDDCYIKNNNSPCSEIFQLIFKFLKSGFYEKRETFLKTEIYPMIVTFMQATLFPNISHFLQKEGFGIADSLFQFLFLFARHDNITKLTTKLLVALFNLKTGDPNVNKSYSMEKFTELVVMANSSKIFTQYFNFCMDVLKANENNSVGFLIYQNLFDYARKYEGSLQGPFLDFVYNKLEKNFGESFSLEMAFTIWSLCEIFAKDQPENVNEKLLDFFYTKRFLKLFERLFKTLKESSAVESLIFGTAETARVTNCQDFNSIKDNVELYLDFAELIKHSKVDKASIAISNLIGLSRLFSLFVSNLIILNKDKFEIKDFSDANNKTLASLMTTFDYITGKVLGSEEKSLAHVLFLNEFLNNFNNSNFFYNIHSYFMTITHLEKQNLDYSMLAHVNIQIIEDKNKQLLSFITDIPNSVLLMKSLLDSIFSYEVNMICIVESKKFLNSASGMKNFVIDTIYNKDILVSLSKYSTVIQKEIEGKMKLNTESSTLNSFFVVNFLNKIFSVEDIEKHEIVFLFLLEHHFFVKHFKNIYDLLNLDFILVEFYSLVRSRHDNLLLRNFIDFIHNFAKLSRNVLQFGIRILMNREIFNNVLADPKVGLAPQLCSLIDHMFSQIIFYSSYKNECAGYITTILTNILLQTGNNNPIINLVMLGKLLSNLYITLTTQVFEETSHRAIEVNKKMKEKLIHILNEDYLPIYLEKVIKSAENILCGKSYSTSHDLDNLLENFDIILHLTALKDISGTSISQTILAKLLKPNSLLENILLFNEISFPKVLNKLLMNYCTLLKQSEVLQTMILENCVLYHIMAKNNQKLLHDLIKALLLDKEFTDDLISREDKYAFTTMVILHLIPSSNSTSTSTSSNISNTHGLPTTQNLSERKGNITMEASKSELHSLFIGKSQILKEIGWILAANILKNADINNALFRDISLEKMIQSLSSGRKEE